MPKRTSDIVSNPELFHPATAETWAARARTVSVLFCQPHSIYKTFMHADVWDAERDAMLYRGNDPVVCHPPCRRFSRLKRLTNAPESEEDLAHFAVANVRRCGGVLEHPAGSTLWEKARLPRGESRDCWGGWSLSLCQFHFGHPAEKRTWLYIVGLEPYELPRIPFRPGAPTHLVSAAWRNKFDERDILSADGRSATPHAFAVWLLDLARATRPPRRPETNIVSIDGQPCPACGGTFRAAERGRPPRYCNDGCRLLAWRKGIR